MRAIDLQAMHDAAQVLRVLLACCGASIICGIITAVRRWPK